MTRNPHLKASRLAKRSSFWDQPSQDVQDNSPRHGKMPSNAVVPLYDQLTSLKTWKEETAELCSAEEGRAGPLATAGHTPETLLHQGLPAGRSCPSESQAEASPEAQQGLPSTPMHAKSTSKRPRQAGSDEILPRHRISEDSAMPLTRNSEMHVKPNQNHDWRQHLGVLSNHLQGVGKPERAFARSSFTSTRPYEARQQRPRQRTFIMADLQPRSSSSIVLQEVGESTSYTDSTGSLWTVGNTALKSIMGSAFYQSTAAICCS